MTIGEIIKAKRIERGMTMQQLADKMGVSRQSVRDVERGYHPNMGIRTIARYARALGETLPSFLLNYTD